MKLLVSVRSPEEAVAALEGGADLIDVKEPNRGSLGKADDDVIVEIVKTIAGRKPVSAAMGELRDAIGVAPSYFGLTYMKWGLAGCTELPWRERLLELRESTTAIVVPCAYADWQRAEAPAVEAVARYAIEHQSPVLLIDTWGKERGNVFTCLSESVLRTLAIELQRNGVALALAGSVSIEDLSFVRRIDAEWLAIRGSVCRDGNRTSTIDPHRVMQLKSALILV